MTKMAILPVPTEAGDITYHAISGDRRSQGKTAGEALDALAAQLPAKERSTLFVIQAQQPDAFFSADQQRRLSDLMTRWRAARDAGTALPESEQAELDALIEEELYASAKRTSAILQELGQ